MKRALISTVPLVAGMALLSSVRPADLAVAPVVAPPAPATAVESAHGQVLLAGSPAVITAAAAVAVPVRRGEERDRAAILQQLRDGETGTYIGEILRQRDSALARWPDRSGRPLRVWIQPWSDIPGWTPRHVERVREAFEAWGGSQIPIPFAFHRDSATAHVHVNWTERFSQQISGRTRWTRDEAWRITDAHILLAVYHHSGEPLDDSALRAMALHEVGHLLGLDHTSDPSSVMAARVRVRALSEADRATVRLLYALPPGALR